MPASLDRENTRLRGGLCSGLISLAAAEGITLGIDDAGGNPGFVAMTVEFGTPVYSTESMCGVADISEGGTMKLPGEGGNLKLDGGNIGF